MFGDIRIGVNQPVHGKIGTHKRLTGRYCPLVMFSGDSPFFLG